MSIVTKLPGALAAILVAGSLVSLPAVADPDAALAELESKVLSKGPNGEDPSPASILELTDAELQQIKDMNATAAIVMHYGGNDWVSRAGRGTSRPVWEDGRRGHRRHRRRIQTRQTGCRH